MTERILKTYSLVVTIALGFALGAVFTQAQQQRPKFEEIDVERINIVERDGKVMMTISNQERFPDAPIDGRVLKRGANQKFPGIVFFNSEGDESGGLTFRSTRTPNGVQASASLNFDQFKQDRTLQLIYGESDGRRTAGLVVWDRPDFPVSQLLDRMNAIEQMPSGADKTSLTDRLSADSAEKRRVYVGKTADRSASVVLSDVQGRPRLVLEVDAAGTPKLEFLDERGSVTERFPTRP